MPAAPDPLRRASPYALAALLVVTGTTHFLAPARYDAIVPPVLPSPRSWTLGSGVAELACAAGLVLPRTRRPAALATAALFVGVFPANVWMAVRPGRVPRWVALARLPLQVPLVRWAWSVSRRTSPGTARDRSLVLLRRGSRH